jgi:hypothetical protein
MTANSNTVPPAREKSTWFQIAQFLFLVVLVVPLYFLGLSMGHNRFHQGGHVDSHGQIGRQRHSHESSLRLSGEVDFGYHLSTMRYRLPAACASYRATN